MDKVVVPLLDLRGQYAKIQDEILPLVTEIMQQQAFILGPHVTQFEADLAQYCQAKHAIGVSSGTDALLLALMALDIGPGDEVITSSYTFFATGGSIARVGATPVFVDIDPVTYNIDPAAIEDALSPRTKAIIPVHLYGQCAEMEPILDIANERGIAVIEDACQAIGSEYRGQRAGTMGTIGCFSFFPSKNLGGFGDAGAVTTNDDKLAKRMKTLRTHGADADYQHQLVGANFRIDALQAAVLKVKLKYLDAWTTQRQKNAAYFEKAFADVGLAGKFLSLPKKVQSRHIYNQYVVRTPYRDAVMDYLNKNDVATRVYYPVPLHLQKCFESLGYAEGSLPQSEKAAKETMALPIYPELTEAQKETIVATMVDAFHSVTGVNSKAA